MSPRRWTVPAASPASPPPDDDRTFYHERNDAVYATYLSVQRSTPAPLDIDSAAAIVATSPQPRFWVPSRTIYNILRRHTHHRYTTEDYQRKPLVRDVVAAYDRLRRHREYQGKSLYFISDFVTAQPTRGFYLSRRRLADIIRRRRKENFDRRRAALKGLQAYERHALLLGLKP